MTKTQTNELPDIAKAAYLLDHGWEFVEPRNQDENRAPPRFTKPGAHGMNYMPLEEAYRLAKGNNDLVASWKKQ